MVISGPVPRHLRLYIPQVPDSYGGRLYFILGPGLGDTVNDLRIVHEVIRMYPKADPVVYADGRWRALCQEIPDVQDLSIRYHQEAPSPMSGNERDVRPYYQTFRSIIAEIIAESTDDPGLVAIGGFKCADRLARKELNIAMKARAIGLSLPPERCRPHFPLTTESLGISERFLEERGVVPENYFVIAPYTAADKMWSHEAWESLITLIHQSTGLPVLIVGDQGGPPFMGGSVHDAIGLPLRLVAGLLARARCFIGLDSGPTHLAACFDIPIVTLNPQGKFPPFLVEAHSPYRWIHLTPGVYGSKPITVESVLEVVRKALISPAPGPCPLCNGLPYVLGAKRGTLLYLCRCGLIYRNSEDTRTEAAPTRLASSNFPLPTSRKALLSLPTAFETKTRHAPNGWNGEGITVTFDHWSPVEADPDRLLSGLESRDLWWTWDAVYVFLNRRGWRIRESTVRTPASNSGALFSVVVKAVPESAVDQDVHLRIPWGRKILDMKRSLYEQWLSWESFQKLDELEGVGWHLANEGKVKDGREILRLALILGRRPRTMERLFRVGCRTLWHSIVGRDDCA